METTHNMLTKLGIPTLFTNLTILLSGATPQPLAQTMQKSIGRIYGISTYTDAVTFNNQPSITTGDASTLYLTFVMGTNNFAGRFRFDDFNYNPLAATGFPADRYLPVNIPGTIDLDKSFIDNPTGLAALNVTINLWYIDKDTYDYMEKQGIVFRNARSLKNG